MADHTNVLVGLLAGFLLRLRNAQQATPEEKNETLALVAHGGVLECAYRAALGLSLDTPRDFKVHNASINRFVVEEGKLKLVSWGEIDHLRQVALDDLP